ncbi:MAG: PKD domain-containing protein [Bacteroidota bacterium]
MKNKLLLLYIFIFLGPLISFASCPGDTARFTTTAGVCKNKTISFTNTSVGTITSYFWDFGDGTTLADTSLLQNPPAYTYPVLGTYTATLIINKGLPCADTFTAFVNMAFVTASFTNDAPNCVSDSVHFTDASVVGPGATITNWVWTFGDPGSGIKNTSTLQNPAHLFTVGNQTYFVKLVTTTSDGCKDSMTVGVGIQSLVVANAGTNITSCHNNPTVNLVGNIANAGGGTWFGSGTFSNASSFTPIYSPTATAKANGVDTVILTSFSSPYCPNVSDTVLIIFNPGPTVSVGLDVSVCKDTSGVPVSATFTGATGVVWHTTSAEGTFADDSLNSTIYFPSTADTAAGSILIYAVTFGNGICVPTRDSLTITFTELPTVVIKTEDTSCSGSPILLDVTVSTGSGRWESTGSGSFLPNNTTLNGVYYPSAADNLAGMITLKFISYNNAGCQPVTDTLNVIIKPSPVASFTTPGACEDSPVHFTDASTAAGTITGWSWAFGDLSLPSLAPSPNHTYSNCGSKNVALIVTADNGCTDSYTQSITVFCLPLANYTASGVCLSDGTVFTNTSTVSGATIDSTMWNFGDMTSSTSATQTHFFPAGGSFPVVLVVESSQGCRDTLTQTVSIMAGPTADFAANDATADINQNITFMDMSVDAVSWAWNFGDGSTGTAAQNPSHIYTVGGVYDVCLISTDLNGCTDTVCHEEIVSTNPAGPSGFSPNGDGQNDVFYVYGGPFKTIEFRVYNNWGELVFESNKQSAGWDGKYKGVDQPIGVYVYTIVGITEDDTKYKVSGDVTLLR